MDEADVMREIQALGRELPHFPDGRIDYTNTAGAPVICVFVRFKGKLLLIKRSNKVGNYKGRWNAITGYLDRPERPEKKALGEVEEETGIAGNLIKAVIPGEPYSYLDGEIGKTWLVCPFIVELNALPEIKLDFEGTEYRWVKPGELGLPGTVSGLGKSYSVCLKEE